MRNNTVTQVITLITEVLSSTSHTQSQIEVARTLCDITKNHPEKRTILRTYRVLEALVRVLTGGNYEGKNGT